MSMEMFETLSSVLMLICSIFSIICTIVFILIVAINRQCHTTNTLLVLNSTIAGFIGSITYLCQSIYQLIDIGNDVLCPIRGFLVHIGTGLLYHALCIIACQRLIVTVYSTRRSLQTTRFTIFIVVLQWLISWTYGLPFLLTGDIKYQEDSRICEVKIEPRFVIETFNNKLSIYHSFVDAN